MTQTVVIANPGKPAALQLAAQAMTELQARGTRPVLSTGQDDSLDGLAPCLAVVLGGDGTVLGAVARLGPTPPPILAFNVGRLGYLADNPPQNLGQLIGMALDGGLQASTRMMIDASLPGWRGTALNEFVLVSRRPGRLLPLSVMVNGAELMDIRGDGIIVATPTGSTAYAMAAGGPVASPDLRAIILAPLCPHQLANRSLVLGPDEEISVCHHSDSPVELMADGRYCRDIQPGETVLFAVSAVQVRFLSASRGKYQVLRDKLGWGWKAEWQKRTSSRLLGMPAGQ